MASVEWTIDGLPDETQDVLWAYVKDVREAYGEGLSGVILYGSAVRGDFLPGRSNLNILLCVPSYDVSLLKQYHGLHARWGKEQIVVPLFMTEGDVRSASSAFPLEYLEIQECHRVLWGQDPFVGFKVDPRYLTIEVIQSLRSNLLRLRQRFVEGGGTEEATTILLPLSITALLPALRGVQRVLGRPISAHGDKLLREVETVLGIDCTALLDAWLLKRGQISPGKKEVPRLLERYLEDLERLVQTVETQFHQDQR